MEKNLILALMIIMFLSELFLTISTEILMKITKIKTIQEFSIFFKELSKSQTKYSEFSKDVKKSKIGIFALFSFYFADSFYWISLIIALFTPIYYVTLGIFILFIIKITKKIYWLDKVFSLIIISSGMLVFLK